MLGRGEESEGGGDRSQQVHRISMVRRRAGEPERRLHLYRRAHDILSVCWTIIIGVSVYTKVEYPFRKRSMRFPPPPLCFLLENGTRRVGRHLQCKRRGDVSNICRQKVALLARRLMVMVVVVMKLMLLLLLLRLVLLLVRMVLKGRLGGGRVARRHQIIRLIEQLRLCLRRCASGRE